MTDPGISIAPRPAFFPGQRLTAADLAGAAGYHRDLRWLHTRALHDWGIVSGFGVTGAKGARMVRVTPGFALDCLGREIILLETTDLPLRTEAGGGSQHYVLTARWIDDADLPPETRQGECETGGAVRRPERCSVVWRDPHDGDPVSRFRPGIDVVLATADVRNCRLAHDLSFDDRRDAKPSPRPYLFAGATPAGNTTWRWWPSATRRYGIGTTVPTNAAGFGATPSYQLQLMGTRVIGNDIADGLVTAYAADHQKVEAVVLMPPGEFGAARLNPPAVRQNGFLDRARDELRWHVAWLGLEP